MPTLTVPSRFNGPPTSGQGGYSAGTLAAHLDGPAAVSLRRPVPLDEALEVRAEDGAKPGGDGVQYPRHGEPGTARDGGQRPRHGELGEARGGEGDGGQGPRRDEGGASEIAARSAARAFDADGELVIEAVAAPPLAPWDAPPVSLDAARAAAAHFVAPADGTFDHCFVCGRARHDGFCVFPGPVAGTDLVAAPWTPPDWAADADGAVLPEFVWATLDCPGYFSVHGVDQALAFLARQQSQIIAPPRAGVEHVVVGRPLGRSGRKGFAATAILDPAGAVLAHSEQLLIVAREP
jgi:hypothetical protein